jgi:hypothetical protein
MAGLQKFLLLLEEETTFIFCESFLLFLQRKKDRPVTQRSWVILVFFDFKGVLKLIELFKLNFSA